MRRWRRIVQYVHGRSKLHRGRLRKQVHGRDLPEWLLRFERQLRHHADRRPVWHQRCGVRRLHGKQSLHPGTVRLLHLRRLPDVPGVPA